WRFALEETQDGDRLHSSGGLKLEAASGMEAKAQRTPGWSQTFQRQNAVIFWVEAVMISGSYTQGQSPDMASLQVPPDHLAAPLSPAGMGVGFDDCLGFKITGQSSA
ncbi:hypothetical protein TNCT_669981, partial [Trichonephila clavata]